MVILFKYNFYLNKINIHFKNGLTTFFKNMYNDICMYFILDISQNLHKILKIGR